MAKDGSSSDSAARCRCGQALEPDHRYCPACGTPASGAAPGHGDPADGPLLLLGGSTGPSAAETTVRTGGPVFVARLIGFGLAAVAVVLVWSLFRQPSSEVAPVPSNDEAVADTEPDRGDDPADPDDTEDPDDPRTGDGEVGDGSSTTSTRPRDRGSTSSDPSGAGSATEGPTPPLLGEETGLRLALGRPGTSTLQLLDLDSGEMEEIEGVGGYPVGHLDSTVVLYSENLGRTTLLDLDDPEAEAIQIGGPDGRYIEVVEVTEDRIWVVGFDNGGGDGTTLEGLDVDGVVVEELEFPVFNRFGFGPGALARASELHYDPAGGLYRRTDDGFELVAEGQVLAAGERLAVIRQCDEALACQLRWYDLRSSGVIGFPAPPPADGEGFYQLLGGDRWLAYFDWQHDRAQLIEVATAKIARDLDMDNFFQFGPSGTAMTSDGRWLLDAVDRMLVVVDLDSGTEWPVGLRGAGLRGIFIEGP